MFYSCNGMDFNINIPLHMYIYYIYLYCNVYPVACLDFICCYVISFMYLQTVQMNINSRIVVFYYHREIVKLSTTLC